MLQTSGLEWIFIFVSILILIFYYTTNKNKLKFPKKITLIVSSLVSLLIFLKILDDVLSQSGIIRLDNFMENSILLIWNPLLVKIILSLNQLMNIFIFLVIFFSVLFAIKSKKHFQGILILSGSILGFLLGTLVKYLTKIARPVDSLITTTGYGFPSNHATFAAATFPLILYCFIDSIKTKHTKKLFFLANIFLILLFGFIRLYLNVHTISEVLAGFALGLFVSSSLILICQELSIK